MAMKDSQRESWANAKRRLASVGMEMKPFSRGLGPALDAYERAVKDYDNTPGTDPAKVDKARAAVKSAAVAAGRIAVEYQGLLIKLEKLCVDPRQKPVLTEATATLMTILNMLNKRM
jgi:hypothetical protein